LPWCITAIWFAEHVDHREVVGDEQAGELHLPLRFCSSSRTRARTDIVERAGGFVGDQQQRFGGRWREQPDALLLAARQLVCGKRPR
jgi:hypothetical protein